LEMYGEKEVILPGHVARGLLLHFVRQVDPSASGLLHELNTAKPYSVVPLRFRSRGRDVKGYVLDPFGGWLAKGQGKIPVKGIESRISSIEEFRFTRQQVEYAKLRAAGEVFLSECASSVFLRGFDSVSKTC